VNGKNRMTPMRLLTGRVLAACLIGAGFAAWGLIGGLPGTALAAASSQCQALPAASSASALSSPPASQAELCVSVQASQSSVKRGQAASFTVQVSARNGSAAGVSVRLAAAPAGQAATFTSRCPGGNGSATCTIGSLATSVAPAAYQMQAQIAVASTATAVTAVTLTATADAATSPAMTALPAASQTVAVTAAAPASPSPAKTKASTAPATTPVAQVSPGLATVLPPVTLAPAPAGVSTTLVSPADVASALPEITPVPVVPTPATGAPGSPVADTSAPEAGTFTLALNMSAATAQVFGLIIVALALTLAATKLVADYLTPRRNNAAKAAEKPAHGKAGNGGTAARMGLFRRSRPQPNPVGQPPTPPQPGPDEPSDHAPRDCQAIDSVTG
jgi:hypothetical protein